jgi:predicted enzyme related to lactoylglutathione lyase
MRSTGQSSDGQPVPPGSSTVEVTLQRDRGATILRLRHVEGVAGGIAKPPEGGPYTTFDVNCDDVQAKLDEAEKLGAKVVMPPMRVPEGPGIAMFSDPDGNIIGLSKM